MLQITLSKNIKNHLLLSETGSLGRKLCLELKTLVETLQSPVTHSFMAKGVLPKEHPLNYFTFGFNQNDEVLPGIKEADLLIVIGFDFVEKLPKDWNERKLPVLHIDTLPAEINEHYPVQAELVGNIKQTLQLLIQSGIQNKSWIPFQETSRKK